MYRPIVIGAALAVATVVSSCALPVVAPMEAIVAAEAGYDSYFEQGLDLIAEHLCENPARDPVTGDCQ